MMTSCNPEQDLTLAVSTTTDTEFVVLTVFDPPDSERHLRVSKSITLRDTELLCIGSDHNFVENVLPIC